MTSLKLKTLLGDYVNTRAIKSGVLVPILVTKTQNDPNEN
jgi:hypothetical protein